MTSTLKSCASSTTGTAPSKCPRRRRSWRPGETLCNTDLGLPVTYVARPADAGTTIVNNAVVTVRTVGAQPQAFQAADPAEVEILAAGEQVEPTTTALPPTRLANTGASSIPQRLVVSAGMVASGWLIVLAARRRDGYGPTDRQA